MNRTMVAILRVLNETGDIVGSGAIARKLRLHGVELTERTVRYHMRILDERGYTTVFGKEGRRITDKGKRELQSSLVSEKVGFVISRIEALSYLTTLNLETMQGSVILNVSYIPEERAREALDILRHVSASHCVMSDRIAFAGPGDCIGDLPVPDGKVGLGTMCSVTINGIFLKAGIPVTSRFGGILETEEERAARFVALIGYEGSSLDPFEIFIRGKMTDVLGNVDRGAGKILASFREIPVVCREAALGLSRKMSERGLGGVLLVGNPNSPLLDIPVGFDKTGMVVAGGLNPIAALEEAGIPTESTAMSTLVEYARLQRFDAAAKEVV